VVTSCTTVPTAIGAMPYCAAFDAVDLQRPVDAGRRQAVGQIDDARHLETAAATCLA
jgi:hypothetical protein